MSRGGGVHLTLNDLRAVGWAFSIFYSCLNEVHLILLMHQYCAI
jgi:hypothetical protein